MSGPDPHRSRPPVTIYRVDYPSAVKGETLTALFRSYASAREFSKRNRGKMWPEEVSADHYRMLIYKNKLEYGAG